jgi:murein L,D-transpeptidase YcbB/YkuD
MDENRIGASLARLLRRQWVRVVAILVVVSSGCVAAAPPAAASVNVSDAINQTVEWVRSGEPLRIGGDTIASTIVLPAMYERRGFQPLWGNKAAVDDLVAAIRDSEKDGLDPADFHLAVIERMRANPSDDPQLVADLDVLFTDALVRLAYQSHFGKVDPERLDPDWNYTRSLRGVEPAETLLETIDAGTPRTFVAGLTPSLPFYTRLKEGLAKYREIAARGGWQSIESGPTLKPGMTDRRVPSLRARLAASGDLAAGASEGGDQYDDSLVAGVKEFQDRHGLEADGVVGPGTLKTLNVPVGQRIEQIRATLERNRWVMNDLPERFILVNVAGFKVYLSDRGQLTWDSRAVVGKPYTKTPIFRGDMKYVVLNPTWTIPASIVRKEILPGMRRDPNYLRRKGYRQVDGQFVQPAGERNALGRIKLMFPNSHSVYLHDTPSKSFFNETSRSFSHGCVRVQKPVELAALALNDPQWSVDALNAAIATGATKTIMLEKPLPVLILYWTAATDVNGRVTFRPDIYGRDPAVIRALNAEWQAPKRPLQRGEVG